MAHNLVNYFFLASDLDWVLSENKYLSVSRVDWSIRDNLVKFAIIYSLFILWHMINLNILMKNESSWKFTIQKKPCCQW